MTALFHHFATQPLPTPAAFTFHFMPRVVLVLGVALTYLVELTLPVLMLLPSRKVRRTCCILIAVFQAIIAFSGNYTFFNLLTVVLCIGACADGATSGGKRGTGEGASRSSALEVVLTLAAVLMFAASSMYLFEIDWSGEKELQLVTATPEAESFLLLREHEPTLTNFGGFEVRPSMLGGLVRVASACASPALTGHCSARCAPSIPGPPLLRRPPHHLGHIRGVRRLARLGRGHRRPADHAICRDGDPAGEGHAGRRHQPASCLQDGGSRRVRHPFRVVRSELRYHPVQAKAGF